VLTTTEEGLPEAVGLVSHDNKAFADASNSSARELHPALMVELSDVGFSGQFRLLKSVVAALDWTGIDDPPATAKAIDAAQEQQGELARRVEAMLVGEELRCPWSGVSCRIVTADEVHVHLLRTIGADGRLALAHLMVSTRVEFEVVFADQGSPFSEHTTATLQLSATASFDSTEERFADLDVSLPSGETVIELVELVLAVDPSVALRTAVSTANVVEQLRRATSGSVFPPEVAEQLRRATSGSVFPPEVAEQLRRATSGSVFPPEVAEQLRRATSGPVFPPEVAEQLRRATSDGATLDRERFDDIDEGPMIETHKQDHDPAQDQDG
jgi:DNA-binding transcriptional regulator YdaS (Cro superfamily)